MIYLFQNCPLRGYYTNGQIDETNGLTNYIRRGKQKCYIFDSIIFMSWKRIIVLLFAGCYLIAAGQQEAGLPRLPNYKYFTVRDGLTNFYKAVSVRKQATVAFVGGSITFNPGWREKVCDYLIKKFPATTFRFIAAGIPSLGSLPHSFRLQRDVLDSGKTDLLFLEAAVNDRANSTDSLTQVKALEGIIRHTLKKNNRTDILLMSFADPDKNNEYAKNLIPVEVNNHETIAAYYNLPSINLAKEISDRLQHKEFSWEKDFVNLHPSPFGQQLYFETIKALLDTCFERVMPPKKHHLPVALNKYNFSKGRYVSPANAHYDQGWTLNNDWVPSDNLATRKGFVHRPMLISTVPGSVLHFTFKGNAIGVAIVSGADAGIISYSIDKGDFKKYNLFTQWSSSLHLPWYILLGSDLKNGNHELEIKIDADKDSRSKGNACRIVYFLVNR
jgi:sialidase-1